MKVIIAGSGELGRLLAATLLTGNHDVILIDNAVDELKQVSDKLDVMTVEGNCTSIAVLKEAGIEDADALLAVSGNEAINILTCQIASKLGVKQTICRLYSSESFSSEDGILPETFGIRNTVSPPEESAEKICAILRRDILLERIRFSIEEAQMILIEITRSSILAGVSIKNIPGPEMLKSIRFSALLRGNQLIVPHGDTIFAPGDKVYVAGKTESLNAFLDWLSPGDMGLRPRLVMAGSDDTGRILAEKALQQGFEVYFIEPDRQRAEHLLDELPSGVTMLEGNATQEDILMEAGVANADAFVSVDPDDEDNILSCILAKRLGARKVICLTHKPEYIWIVPAMEMIDCGLSATLVSVNSILRQLEAGAMRADAILQRFRAHLTEFRVSPKSPLCGKMLKNCKLPSSLILSLIFRGNEVIIPSGETCLYANDKAVAIVTKEGVREIEPLFPG